MNIIIENGSFVVLGTFRRNMILNYLLRYFAKKTLFYEAAAQEFH